MLGANDGIISTASLIVGVAAAATTRNDVLIAGVAGLVAGAMSMSAGEYVSVSSQSGGGVPFTEEQLAAMLGGLTVEQYRRKTINKWGLVVQSIARTEHSARACTHKSTLTHRR